MVRIVPVEIGDVVKMKRKHPCGGNQWEVIKLGIDISLKCLGCGRQVRLLRSRFEHRFRGYIHQVKS